jgi:hypothetical protein
MSTMDDEEWKNATMDDGSKRSKEGMRFEVDEGY